MVRPSLTVVSPSCPILDLKVDDEQGAESDFDPGNSVNGMSD